MELKYLHVYKNLGEYLERIQEQDAWEQIMIAPFWDQIAEWAPFSIDFMKPAPMNDVQMVQRQIDCFRQLNFAELTGEFERAVEKLPKPDDDAMTIAFYPSGNNMEEGVFGSGAWGNIILNINASNPSSVRWLPFVFAHEYHHNVLDFHWYCVKGGKDTKGNFLEAMINEGQADYFAHSIYPAFLPSWHKGVAPMYEQAAWENLKKVLYMEAPAEAFAPYMFGSAEHNIPPNAGYYFGFSIVRDYAARHPGLSAGELLQTPHQVLFDESRFSQLP